MRSLNKIKHGLSILALAVSAQSALAASEWQINPLGSGVTGASTVSTLNVGGVGFVEILPDTNTPTLFSFIEHGAYQAYAPDSYSPFPSHEITVTYSVSGTNSFVDPGALHMTSGRIDLFSDANGDFGTDASHYGADNGTLIASFNIVDGYVANAQGLVVVNATGIAGSFAQGYLFNAAGTDLAMLSNIQLQLGLFSLPIEPNAPITSGIICGLANACSNSRSALSMQAFTVQDTGSVSISAVPEPETSAMLLVGLGLIGTIARRRRR